MSPNICQLSLRAIHESGGNYSINLPSKGWYDYWTGQVIVSDNVIETQHLERLPVFVRPGAIIPRQPLTQSTQETPNGPLEIHVYIGKDCHGSLYFDDGVSFNYKQGDYLRQDIRCTYQGGKLTVDFGPRKGHYAPWWKQISIIIHGLDNSPSKIKLNKKLLKGDYNVALHILHINVPDLAKTSQLIVTM